jgi:hypothetical protein
MTTQCLVESRIPFSWERRSSSARIALVSWLVGDWGSLKEPILDSFKQNLLTRFVYLSTVSLSTLYHTNRTREFFLKEDRFLPRTPLLMNSLFQEALPAAYPGCGPRFRRSQLNLIPGEADEILHVGVLGRTFIRK